MKKLSVSAKKAIAIGGLLLLSLIICFAVSRLGRAIDDDEAREILSNLLPKEAALNEIVFGEGLSPEDNSEPLKNVSGAQYRTVTPDSPYRTKQALLDALGEVYTADYIKNTLMPILFDGVSSDNDSLASLPARYAETEGVLAVDITYDSNMTLVYTADPSSARVVSGRLGYITVEVELTSDAGEKTSAKLELKKQDGEYLLAASSYTS